MNGTICPWIACGKRPSHVEAAQSKHGDRSGPHAPAISSPRNVYGSTINLPFILSWPKPQNFAHLKS